MTTRKLFSCRQPSLGGIFLRIVLMAVVAMAGRQGMAAETNSETLQTLTATSGQGTLCSWSMATGTGDAAPEYKDSKLCFYSGNTLTISSDTRLIRQIQITGTVTGKQTWKDNVTADEGGISTSAKTSVTWKYDAENSYDGCQKVTFTNDNTDDGSLAITQIVVTYVTRFAPAYQFELNGDKVTAFTVLPGWDDFESPEIAFTSAKATVAENYNLSVDDLEFTWTSADSAVASVDEDGLVTIGTTVNTTGIKITATNKETPLATAASGTYTIKVKQATVDTKTSGFYRDDTKVSATLSVKGTELEDFEKPELQMHFTAANFSPAIDAPDDVIAYNVVYSSSDAKIAEVDAETGDITFGDQEGTVTITATVSSEKNQFKQTAYSYRIKVTKAALTAKFVDDEGTKLTAVTLLPGADFVLPELVAASGDDDVEVESVTITSSDGDVASYDEESEQLIIGTKVGTATLTATATAGSAYKTATTTLQITTKQATAAARFLDDEEHTVSSVSLKATETGDFTAPQLGVTFSGKGFSPAVDFEQDGAIDYVVAYSSDNDAVATIDEEGAVTLGEATGTATITARVSSELNQFAELTATYSITMAPVPLVATFDVSSYATRTGRDFTEENVLSVEDADGREVTDYEVVFASSDAEVAAVDEESGAVSIGTKVGTATITATVTADWMYTPATATYTIDVAEGFATLHITAAGYATYCGDEALDFSAVGGLTAYTASIDADGWLSFDAVDELPAHEGVLLEGSEGYYEVPVIDEAAEVENDFIGVTEETVVSTPGIYVLLRGDAGVGFYRTTTAFTVGARSAYLPALPAETRSFIAIDGTDAIATATMRGTDGSRAVYNLHGQRISSVRRGMYIVDGRKVFVR